MHHADLLITGGTVLTLDARRRVIADGAVAVQNGRILRVGKSADLSAAYAASRVMNAQNKVIMPGLINGHSHLLGHARGLIPDTLDTREFVCGWLYPYWGSVDQEDEYWGGLNAICEQIKTGTTCFVDPGCKYLASTVRAVADSGIRCAIGQFTWDVPERSIGHPVPGLPTTSTEQALARLAHDLSAVANPAPDRIRIQATLEGVGTCSDALMLGARELADRHRTLLVMHKASSEGEVERELKATGHRVVEHMYRIGVLGPNVFLLHALAVNADEVAMLAETQTKVCHSPSAALKLGKGLARLGRFIEMMEAGVTVCLGCDGSNSSDYRDMIRAIYLAAVLPKDYRGDPAVMTAERAIEMATIDAARALGWENEIGSIEEGKRADIILLDTDRPEWVPTYDYARTLVYSATGDSVNTVIVDGKILMEQRTLRTIDEGAVRERVQARRGDFLKRSGLKPVSRWPMA